MKTFKEFLQEAQYQGSWKNVLKKEPSENAIYTYNEVLDEVKNRMFTKLLNGSSQFKSKLITYNELKLIYDEHKNLGFVRSEKILQKIIDKIVYNFAKLEVNNLLSGHSELDPYLEYEYMYEDEDLITEEEFEDLIDQYVPYDSYSDYGTKWAGEIVLRLIDAKTDDDKIILINHLMDVIHQRSDFSEYFVEGGKNTLMKLSHSNYGVKEE